MITDADDFTLELRDGPFWAVYRLDWSGRMFVTTYEGDTAGEREPTGCTSHAHNDIQAIHELTGAILARLERKP